MIDEVGHLKSLRQRLERFHGVSLERVLGEVEYLRDHRDCVIAGGSLAYGLGNQLSDLDLVITGPETVESSRVPLEHFVGSLRVDVWKLARRLVDDSFDRACEALASRGPLLGSFGDVDHEDELKLLHRVAFGLVIDGDGVEPKRDLDRAAVASRLVAREYAERMRTAALVAQLARRTGRSLAAVSSARLAVECALNAVVAHRGLPFSGDKWLCERLAGPAADLAPVYDPFRQLPSAPERDHATFVEAARDTCEEIWDVELGAEGLMAMARWRNGDLRLVEASGEWFLLSAEAAGVWELEKTEVEAWRRLTAADEGPGLNVDAGDAEAQLLCLRLHEQGLLELEWVEGVEIDEPKASKHERAET